MSRWLRCTLLANGLSGDMPLEDAWDCAEMLAATGRAVDPRKWIDDMREWDQEQNLEGLL